ncbi:hypothetical protein CIPAW_08G134100 [Carya illinoinensis]|uniref:Transmembrane protein n=1 Tax=Carya illinoinensis TaxID=32201 RepID=A0A8T1PUW1_CARIL|nr:hypothetical protein CIPAW_08G134100 [Carya illinoinensis]
MTCKMVFSKIHSKVVMVLMALIVAIMLLPCSEAALANAKPGQRVLGQVPVKVPRVQPPPPPHLPPHLPLGQSGRGSYSHPPSNYP